MSRAAIIVVLLAACGCSDAPSSPPAPAAAKPPPPTSPPAGPVMYDPRTFRADVTKFIDAGQYREAVALVKRADVDRQLAADGSGYVAIGEDMILLPGVCPQVEYDRSRDWYMPGTQDAIEDLEWQRVASEFAERYNRRRRGMSR